MTKSTADTSGIGVVSASTEEGADVVQWTCNDSDDQKWVLEIKVDPINGELIKNLIVKDIERHTYWNIAQGLAEGSLLYGDRPATYTSVPDVLKGAEYIITSCDSKYWADDLATFTAGDDITVYVGLDARVEVPPAWLTEWELTELTFSNTNNVVFNLYRKDFDSGEIVTLGTNGDSTTCVNYTAMAVLRTAQEELKGDVNLDGKVDVADAVKLQNHLLRALELTAQEQAEADVCEDGILNSFDVIFLRRILKG